MPDLTDTVAATPEIVVFLLSFCVVFLCCLPVLVHLPFLQLMLFRASCVKVCGLKAFAMPTPTKPRAQP